jgi:acyl-CoA synthetase (AMP-forming)/AMP-acid ligase II
MNMALSGMAAAAEAGLKRPANEFVPCPLVASPLSHAGGYLQVLMAAMFGSKMAVLIGQKNSETLASFIEQNKVTSVLGLDLATSRELLRSTKGTSRLCTLRSWSITGVPLNSNFIREIHEVLPDVTLSMGYGLTETNGGICSILGKQILEYPGSSGPIIPTVEVKIVNGDSTAVASRGAGNIWVRGPMMIKGYCSETGELARLDGGWLDTGDIGFLSADNHLCVMDRRCEQLHFGDLVISSADIERYLETIEGIDEACAVKIGANGDSQLVIAILGSTQLATFEGLSQEVARHLECSIRSTFIRLSRFPRTNSGKLDREAIRGCLRNALSSPES